MDSEIQRQPRQGQVVEQPSLYTCSHYEFEKHTMLTAEWVSNSICTLMTSRYNRKEIRKKNVKNNYAVVGYENAWVLQLLWQGLQIVIITISILSDTDHDTVYS